MSGPATGGGTNRPRAAAIIGPYGSGKSTLFEALMIAGGAQLKRGDPRTRRMGTELRLGHCGFLGDSWSLIDLVDENDVRDAAIVELFQQGGDEQGLGVVGFADDDGDVHGTEGG